MGLATYSASPKLRYIGDELSTDRQAPRCYIRIPSALISKAHASTTLIRMYILPDVSDSKQAVYNNEPVPGRSFPLKTYSHSDDRQIGIQLHFVTDCYDRIWENLMYLRMLQSAVYPQYHASDVPYYPPPVCKIVIGQLLSSCPLNAVLKSYQVRYPTDVAWDERTLLPEKFDVDTSWEVVFKPKDLPGQEKILMDLESVLGAGVTKSYLNYVETSGKNYRPDCPPDGSTPSINQGDFNIDETIAGTS